VTTTLPPVPARLSVPGSLAVARACCPPECFAYHAAWRFFRRTGLKGHPGWHVGLLRLLVAEQPPSPGPVRVLICAASDEAMLACLTRVLDPDRLRVQMLDACPTPLVLASAYAARHGIALTTRRHRVPGLPDFDAPFDIAVTDGLLSLLPRPGQRSELLGQIAARLAPGGLFVYTTRIAGPSGVLEYDRLGRVVQALAARVAWRGPVEERRRMARQVLGKVSRPSPFTSPAQLTEAVAEHFAEVRTFVRRSPASLPVHAHRLLHGEAGTCVGISATVPRRAA
jgi:hypothetical protein